MKQKGFFDETDVLRELSELGDPLEKLNTFIKWDRYCIEISLPGVALSPVPGVWYLPRYGLFVNVNYDHPRKIKG
jgi:hypothetical protein